MLIKQPFFIGGINDVEAAKGSAFGAAGMFFFTFLASILYLIRDSRRVSDIRVIEGSSGYGRVRTNSISNNGDEVSVGSRGSTHSSSYAERALSLTRRVRGDNVRGEYGQVSVFEDFDEGEAQLEPLQTRGGYLS